MARKSAIGTLGSQAGIQVVGLVTGILVARYLGPGGRGELAAIIAWASMLAYAGNFGLPAAFTYAAAREPDQVRQTLGNGILAALVQWPVLIVLGMLVLPLALSEQPPDVRHLALLYLCLYVPLNLLTLYANAVQRGLGRYRGFNAIRLCVPISYLLALGALVLTGHMTVGGVVGANLLSNLAALMLALTFVLPMLRDKRDTHGLFDLPALRRDARYGLSAHLGTLQPFNSMRIDVLLLTMVLTSHDLGLYMVALAAAGLVKAQGLALGMVAMPEVAKQRNSNAQRRVIVRFALYTLLLGCATAGVAVVWARPLVELVYGSQFSGAATPLRLLVLGGVAASLYRVIGDGLRGMGRPLIGTAAEVGSLAVGVPAILLLAPGSGVNGAAVAVGLASVAALGVAIWALIRMPASADEIVTDQRIGASECMASEKTS